LKRVGTEDFTPARRAGQRRDQRGELQHLPRLVGERGAEQLGHAELVAVAAHRTRRFHPARLGCHIENAVGHRHRGLAVDGRVVHFRIEAEAAVGEALDHVELPQRPAAVEQAGVQARTQRFHLRHRAGLGQHEVAHVVVEVDVVVVDPHRVGEVERHQRQLAREHRRQVHAAGHVRLHGFIPGAGVARRRVEQRQAAHVHRHLGALEVQEGTVDDAQVFHVAHDVVSFIRREAAGELFDVVPRF
jgi:hypothetical protein